MSTLHIITFGSFDLLHVGHIRILEKIKSMYPDSTLTVGISSDELSYKKGKINIIPFIQRIELINSLKYVDAVFCEETLEKKPEYIEKYNADLLIMGNDWKGEFDNMPCKVEYLARTDEISTTGIITRILVNIEKHNKQFKKYYIYISDYHGKHESVGSELIHNLKKLGCNIITSGNIPENISLILAFNRSRMVDALRLKFPRVPIVMIDHGASHLKWFLADNVRFNIFDLLLLAGPEHVKVYLNLYGKHKKVESVGFVGAPRTLRLKSDSKERICKKYNLNPLLPIIFYAPTWYSNVTNDYIEIANQLATIPNVIIIEHFQDPSLSLKNKVHKLNCFTSGENINSYDILPYIDLLVSDTSSLLVEATARHIPVVQIKMDNYSDNPSGQYMLPIIAGSRKYFRIGNTSLPSQLAEVIKLALKKDSYLLATNQEHIKGSLIINDSIPLAIEKIISQANCPELNHNQISEIGNKEARIILDKISYEYLGHEIYSKDMDLVNLLSSGAITINAARLFLLTRREYRQKYQMTVGHAGGQYNDIVYSNSLEALQTNIDKGQKLFELDILMTIDGHVILAHANHEKAYGLKEKKIHELTLKEFKLLRYWNKCTTLSFVDLVALLYKCPEVKVILDIGYYYDITIDAISKIIEDSGKNVFHQIIPQVFNLPGFEFARKNPFHGFVYAIWKFNDETPYSKKVVEEINFCIEKEPFKMFGVSLRINDINNIDKHQIDNPKVDRLFACGLRIFLHGITEKDNAVKLLEKDFGVFIHDVSSYIVSG